MRRRILQGVALLGVAALVLAVVADWRPLIGIGAVLLFGGLVGAGMQGSAGKARDGGEGGA